MKRLALIGLLLIGCSGATAAQEDAYIRCYEMGIAGTDDVIYQNSVHRACEQEHLR